MHAAVIHHIGAADSLNVHPVYHQLNRGNISCLKKLHHKIIINWFSMSDLLDAEINTLGGKLVIPT